MAESKAKEGPTENKAAKADPRDALAKAENAVGFVGTRNGGRATAEQADEYAKSLLPDDSPLVRVTEDVYEDFFHPGSDRPSKKLLYFRGQLVNADVVGKDVPTEKV